MTRIAGTDWVLVDSEPSERLMSLAANRNYTASGTGSSVGGELSTECFVETRCPCDRSMEDRASSLCPLPAAMDGWINRCLVR